MISAVLLATCLVVSSGSAASPASATETADPLMTVGVVGDSIAHQAQSRIETYLDQQGRGITHLDLRDAATIDTIHDDTVAAMTGPDAPDILVLVLGTAQAHDIYWPFPRSSVGTKWERDLRGLLNEVTPHVACTRVFDIQERDTGFYIGVDRHSPEMNAATRRVVSEFDDTEYFHYSHWTDLVGLAYDWGDGLHHNGPGRAAVARMIQDAADGCDPATSTEPFWDVHPGHWAENQIRWAADQGLVAGYDNGSFRDKIDKAVVPLSRGQAIRMLWRFEESPPATPHEWADGMPWLQGALDWAWTEKVAAGFADGTFRPSASITRAQTAKMIWEQAGAPTATGPHLWSDGRPWADAALDWMAETGLMIGWSDGTFRPDEPISRSAMARLLFNLDELVSLPPPAPLPAPAAPEATAPPPTVAPAVSTAPSTSLAPAPTTVTTAG